MSSQSLREGFVKPSRCLHEAFTQWARRGASAKGSRRLHERFMKTRRLREGFSKASAIPTEASWSLLGGFAKPSRAPPFGNDSSDNDKPPYAGQIAENQLRILHTYLVNGLLYALYASFFNASAPPRYLLSHAHQSQAQHGTTSGACHEPECQGTYLSYFRKQ